MATSYTYKLCKGEQSFRDFVLQCSDAFLGRERFGYPAGALTPISPDTYYQQGLPDAEKQLELAKAMSLEEAAKACEVQYIESYASFIQSEKNKLDTRNRLLAMREKVEAWQIPDDLADLKKFMLDQLGGDLRYTEPREPPEKMTTEDYCTLKVDMAERMVQVYKEGIERERQRVTGINKWIQDLAASLPTE
jgi:hypothetical protein